MFDLVLVLVVSSTWQGSMDSSVHIVVTLLSCYNVSLN